MTVQLPSGVTPNQASVIETAAINLGEAGTNDVERKTAFFAALRAAGFKADTDFTAGTAKEADRRDRFEYLKDVAWRLHPKAVYLAHIANDRNGDRMVTGAYPNLPKSDPRNNRKLNRWSNEIPAKMRTLKAQMIEWEILKNYREAPEKVEKAPPSITKMVAANIKAIKTVLAGDTDSRRERIDVDVEEMIAAMAAFDRAVKNANNTFAKAAQESATRDAE